MSEQIVNVPHSLKEAELSQFKDNEEAFITPSSLYADSNDHLYVKADATARGKASSEYCAKVEKVNAKFDGPSIYGEFPSVKVDLSGCSENQKVIRVQAPPERYNWSNLPQYSQYPFNSVAAHPLPVIQLVDKKSDK